MDLEARKQILKLKHTVSDLIMLFDMCEGILTGSQTGSTDTWKIIEKAVFRAKGVLGQAPNPIHND